VGQHVRGNAAARIGHADEGVEARAVKDGDDHVGKHGAVRVPRQGGLHGVLQQLGHAARSMTKHGQSHTEFEEKN
jgi:hypothetical protein